MVTIGEMLVRLVTDTGEFKTQMSGATKSVDELSKSAEGSKRMWDAASKGIVAGITVIGAAMTFAVKEAMASEKANLQLFASLNSVGMGTDKAFESLDALAQKLMEVSGIGDEDIKQSMQSLILLTGDYDVALKYTQTAMDVSAATGRELSGVTRALGMAYNGNSAQLKRMGVALQEGVKGTQALDIVTKKFKGSMDAVSESVDVKLRKQMTRLGEFAEAIGTQLLPAFADVIDAGGKATTWWEGFLSEERMQNIIVAGTNILTFFSDYLIPAIAQTFFGLWDQISSVWMGIGNTLEAMLDGTMLKEGLSRTVKNQLAIINEAFRGSDQIQQELFKNWQAGLLTVEEYAKRVLAVKESYKKLKQDGQQALTPFERELEALLGKLTAVTDKFWELDNTVKLISDAAATSFTMLGQKLVETGGKMGEAWKEISKSVLGTIIDAFITQVSGMMAVYTAQLFNPLTSATATTGMIVSAAQLTGLGALKAGINTMANGGIVNGATAMIAGEAGPEAILPLSKLQPMMDSAINNSSTSNTTFKVYVDGAKDINWDAEMVKMERARSRYNIRTGRN